MTPWQEFYQSVRSPQWPDCDEEENFANLPAWIQSECQDVHGYVPGEYRRQPRLPHRRFPIITDTACQLKWTWSTIFLTTGHTASCHRTNHHRFDIKTFDFHNTPQKIQDRRKMIQGQWPDQGCDYCKDIERAGGQSDRMTNLDMVGIHAPPELDQNSVATRVTPRILEVYFDNLCNLKCVYCGPPFSSLWDAENKKHGTFKKNNLIISDSFQKDNQIEQNKKSMFSWLRTHAHELTNFNILGGEPLFQPDFDTCLDFFQQYPSPNLELQIFSNLNATQHRVQAMIKKVNRLIDQGHIRQFTVTASLDCWGPEAEYARFPLDLNVWQQNFELLLAQPWIRLIVGSTITPLTIKTLPDLMLKLNHWRQTREVYHYFNSVNGPDYLCIDILGDAFASDFQRAIELLPNNTVEQQNVRDYLHGIALESASKQANVAQVLRLYTFLEELDRRRQTSWRKVYSWLEPIIYRILNDSPQPTQVAAY